ncbi:MAG: hypothetical protein JSV68_24905 [Anaerolineaceae bacterium]|nr:MAG: hypothetical protein JSV68_24905 [Anaerolineaceae bacterium]
MARTCDNCSRPVFDTDTVCWHCGWKLSSPEESAAETIPAAETLIEETVPAEPKPIEWPLALFYGVLTTIVLLALLLLMRSLGRSPTIAFKSDAIPGEWVSLNDPQKLFSVDVPADWSWYFQKGQQTQPSLKHLIEDDARIPTAVAPLGDIVSDLEYLLFSKNESDFLVVARSERLNRLTAQQAVVSLQEEPFENTIVNEARLIRNTAGEDTAVFALEHMEPPLFCVQSLTPNTTETYLVAACTSPENHALHSHELNVVLNSFQTLSR